VGTRLLSRLPQRSFIYLVSVYVLDPNLPPLAPPMIRFENGVLGIVGNYFGGLFSALSFDFPSHMRSPFLRLRYVCLLRCLSRVPAETACHEYVTCIPTSGSSRCAGDPSQMAMTRSLGLSHLRLSLSIAVVARDKAGNARGASFRSPAVGHALIMYRTLGSMERTEPLTRSCQSFILCHHPLASSSACNSRNWNGANASRSLAPQRSGRSRRAHSSGRRQLM
jgi:hypothetical protein